MNILLKKSLLNSHQRCVCFSGEIVVGDSIDRANSDCSNFEYITGFESHANMLPSSRINFLPSSRVGLLDMLFGRHRRQKGSGGVDFGVL
jgi:hypothetical protein